MPNLLADGGREGLVCFSEGLRQTAGKCRGLYRSTVDHDGKA
jgi:hypothetical protein